MADQDFKINIRTLADLTGIELTRKQLKALQDAAKQGNQDAIAEIRNLQGAIASAQLNKAGDQFLSGIGIGAFTASLGALVSQWRAFDQEQDRIFENSLKTIQKMRELGDSIIEMKDKMIEGKRLGAEPLEQQFIDLQKTITRLKTEQSLLNLPQQAKEWQDYQKEIDATGNSLEKVRQELEKTKPGGTAQPEIPFPKAQKGESQALVDEIERNRRAAEENLKEDIWEFDPETGGYKRTGKKQFPLYKTPPSPPPSPDNPVAIADQYKSPIGPPIEKGGLNTLAADVIEGAMRKAVEAVMAKYWGP